MTTIVRIDLHVEHQVWCPTCQADSAKTTSGIGSRRGLSIVRDYAVTYCHRCNVAWSSHPTLTLPDGHPSKGGVDNDPPPSPTWHPCRGGVPPKGATPSGEG